MPVNDYKQGKCLTIWASVQAVCRHTVGPAQPPPQGWRKRSSDAERHSQPGAPEPHTEIQFLMGEKGKAPKCSRFMVLGSDTWQKFLFFFCSSVFSISCNYFCNKGKLFLKCLFAHEMHKNMRLRQQWNKLSIWFNDFQSSKSIVLIIQLSKPCLTES